jgi:cbb3-type cytochrome oxidase maturation protein
MSVLYIVFPLALVVVAFAVAAYVWATRSGQLDDLETPALRMLHDDSDAALATTRARDDSIGGADGSGRADASG